jgi:hypothetical protein
MITTRLLALVEALSHIGFGIVLLDPGQNMLGIEGYAVDRGRLLDLEFSENQSNAVGQQELQQGIGQASHQPVEVALRGKTGLGLKPSG